MVRGRSDRKATKRRRRLDEMTIVIPKPPAMPKSSLFGRQATANFWRARRAENAKQARQLWIAFKRWNDEVMKLLTQ